MRCSETRSYPRLLLSSGSQASLCAGCCKRRPDRNRLRKSLHRHCRAVEVSCQFEVQAVVHEKRTAHDFLLLYHFVVNRPEAVESVSVQAPKVDGRRATQVLLGVEEGEHDGLRDVLVGGQVSLTRRREPVKISLLYGLADVLVVGHHSSGQGEVFVRPLVEI